MTMEQQFKMRQIEDALNHPSTRKEDIITVFLALQEQCFVLGNNVSNLVKQWPIHPLKDQAITREEESKSGTSLETKT
jgi:hypothetical protein